MRRPSQRGSSSLGWHRVRPRCMTLRHLFDRPPTWTKHPLFSRIYRRVLTGPFDWFVHAHKATHPPHSLCSFCYVLKYCMPPVVCGIRRDRREGDRGVKRQPSTLDVLAPGRPSPIYYTRSHLGVCGSGSHLPPNLPRRGGNREGGGDEAGNGAELPRSHRVNHLLGRQAVNHGEQLVVPSEVKVQSPPAECVPHVIGWPCEHRPM